ncbi:MAG TPA: putative porin [Candidatus Acidoferrum sp.]|nr:putative porin [Candidatus Acidoferrum sp.]
MKTKTAATVALCASATALLGLAPLAHADTAVEALLNKLEQKGILTVEEAKALKAENTQDTAADFNKSFAAKMGTPDWLTSYKFGGDFRDRWDDMSSDNSSVVDRERLRYRLRFGFNLTLKDDFDIIFKLGSGDGGAVTNNQTFGVDGSKKILYVDTAYFRWTVKNDDWTVVTSMGKMNQTMDTQMILDPDYTPEGGAVQVAYKLGRSDTLRFNSVAYALDELSTNKRDPYLWGTQLMWDSRYSSNVSSTLGVSVYDITNQTSLTHAYNSNSGNTIVGGNYAHSYRPVVVDANVTFNQDSTPIKLIGEYLENQDADIDNKGWYAGFVYGKAAKKGSWDFAYRYQSLEADAWWDQIIDDDNIAAMPTSSTVAAIHGGTNVKGNWIKFNYMLTDALTFTTTIYKNTVVKNLFPINSTTDGFHSMVDLMWKF